MRAIAIFVALIVGFMGSAQAAYKDSSDVKVKLISVWSLSGGVLLQTEPKPDISGLTCSNDYWLVLSTTAAGYQPTIAMLMAAQATGKSITVRAEDNSGNEFCLLSRIISKDA